MPYKQYRRPDNRTKKQAYKAGLRAGEVLVIWVNRNRVRAGNKAKYQQRKYFHRPQKVTEFLSTEGISQKS